MSEIPKGYIIVPASAWHELVQYELRCQELAAQVEVLGDKLSEVVALLDVDGMTAVQWLLDNCQEIESLTNTEPQQHLAEIRAQAVEQFALHVSDNMDDGIDRAKLTILASERIYSIRRGEVE